MSDHNKETFSKFMKNIARKMIDRQDSYLIGIDELEAKMALVHAQNYAAMHGLMPSGVTLPTKTKFHGPSIKDYAPVGNLVTAEEIEVMRAYFNGDDVLVTLLQQDR